VGRMPSAMGTDGMCGREISNLSRSAILKSGVKRSESETDRSKILINESVDVEARILPEGCQSRLKNFPVGL
jgi:hypothetical protein